MNDGLSLFSTDGNRGGRTDVHKLYKPTTNSLLDRDQQVMETSNRSQTRNHQRDAAGNNSTWLACASAWNSLLSAVKLVLKWLYIGIEWPKDTKSDAFARRTVTASDSTCPADGVSLALMSTLLLIPDSFCTGAKTIQDS